jgi:pyruvate/2-oxoglutarate dehydrogenase complex dihydrolipoamide dehydrogenase (E3) component
VDVRLRSKATSVNYDQDSGFTIHTEQDRVQVDQLLIATGRRPNVDNMGLDKVGVELFGHGIKVDDRLQTTSPDIFAVGDVATPYQFTHVADTMARMVVRNAFFFGNERFSDLVIPWCTFTDPEVAHVGLYPRDLKERGVEFSTYRKDFSQTDRGLLEGSDGFVMIHTRKSGDEILGATIVGEHAGDMISEITVAMAAGLGLGAIAGVIHPYPTLAEAIRKCGDDYNRGRLTPTVARLLRGILSARR